MGNNLAQKDTVSFLSMFKDSFSELFSPASERSLVNYNELKLIDTSHLKFIDTNHLQLINVATLLFGVKYVAFLGAYMLVLGGFGLTYMSIKVEETNYQIAVARDNQYKIAMLNKRYEHLKVTPPRVVAYSAKEAVLGATDIKLGSVDVVSVPKLKDNADVVEKLTSVAKPVSIVVNKSEELLPSCSFTVEDEMYASGASLELSGVSNQVCVAHNGDSIDWYVRGNGGTSSAGDCYNLPTNLKKGTVVVNVFNAQSELTGSCSLKFTR